MSGIKETQEALAFAVAIGNATGISLQDGKFDTMDIVNYVGALTKFPAAVEGANQIPVELKDLDEAESQALIAQIKDQLDLPQDEIEEAIEDHLEVVRVIYNLAQKYYIK